MGIIIAGHIGFDPATVQRTIVDARPLIEAALREPGCRAYDWAIDPLVPGRVCVYERWDDETSLAGHFACAPYAEMGAHLNAAGIIEFDVRKCRFDRFEPVYDEDGIARADFFG